MVKADIAAQVQEKLNLTSKQAGEIVDAVFDTMKDTLIAGHDLKINGFGNFAVQDRASRKGRNPKTGEEITIPAHRTLSFKPGKALKEGINGI